METTSYEFATAEELVQAVCEKDNPTDLELALMHMVIYYQEFGEALLEDCACEKPLASLQIVRNAA